MKLNFVRQSLVAAFESEKITDFASFDKFLRTHTPEGLFSNRHSSQVLHDAIQRFETEFKTSFYKELLPKIIAWSLREEPLYVDLLEQGSDSSCSLSETEIRYLLANAFFGNLTTFRELNLKSLALKSEEEENNEESNKNDNNSSSSSSSSSNDNNNDNKSSSTNDNKNKSSSTSTIKSRVESQFKNQYRQFGEVNFCKLYDRRHISEAEERVMCILAYFLEADDCSSSQRVTFSRVSSKTAPEWTKCEKLISREKTLVHDGLMEAVMLESDNPIFVDFANKNLHIHQIIPSCTQEEILFSCAPSCFISMLITETLLPNEAVIIRNVRRYCIYSGYLDTFKFVGLNTHKSHRFDVAAIDACTHNHFSHENNERDMLKMYLACKAGQSLSSGNWGCGIFGGDDSHKFVQQVLVACYCDTKLYFSATGERGTRMKVLLDKMVESKLSVGQIYSIVLRFNGPRGEKTFAKHFLSALAHKANAQ